MIINEDLYSMATRKSNILRDTLKKLEDASTGKSKMAKCDIADLKKSIESAERQLGSLTVSIKKNKLFENHI